MPRVIITESRYANYPDLQLAIAEHRAARLNVDYARNPATLYILRKARALERKLRTKYAKLIRQDKIVARVAANRRKRYASQHARRSRTLDTAASTRANRATVRQLARTAAEQKRADNQLANGITPRSSKSAR